MNNQPRSGFTLVELLVVLVLGMFVLLATYQVLVSNTRVYAANTARAQGQQTLRGGVDILSGELREISTAGGDLLEMGTDSLTIRAQRTFGLVCAVDYTASPVRITSYSIGPIFEMGDSIFVFHDNEAALASDDEWFGGTVSSVSANTDCSGSSSQVLAVPSLRTTATASPPDSVRVGAPIRGFETLTLGEYTFDGETFLGRRVAGSAEADLLVGPLLDSRGVTFRYLDNRGQVTTVPTDVAQIEITLRYESDMKTFQGVPVSDSVLVRVFPRN
jgi:prepilin-type N-terminal cleavage/methylation domain-containing protein